MTKRDWNKLDKTDVGIIKVCKSSFDQKLYKNRLDLLKHYISINYGYGCYKERNEVEDNTVFAILKNLFNKLEKYKTYMLSQFFLEYNDVIVYNNLLNWKYEENQLMIATLICMLSNLQVRENGLPLYGIEEEDLSEDLKIESWK